MANEIWTKYPSGNSLDAYIFKQTDDKVFDQSDGGDTFEAWEDGNVLNYDNPMTDQGDGYYTVDFPAVITTLGVYRVVIKVRAGAGAAVADKGVAQGEIYWSGTAEQTIQTIVITNNTTTNVYDESTPPPITVINESYL